MYLIVLFLLLFLSLLLWHGQRNLILLHVKLHNQITKVKIPTNKHKVKKFNSIRDQDLNSYQNMFITVPSSCFSQFIWQDKLLVFCQAVVRATNTNKTLRFCVSVHIFPKHQRTLNIHI